MKFVLAYCIMISTNQIAFFERSAVFLKMIKVILLCFRVTSGMYSTQIKRSKLPKYFQSHKSND